MHFVVIFGPPAVGKMTVGYELAKRTGFKLLHNHMTIDLVLNFFPFGDPQFSTLVGEFRRRIVEEVAVSDAPGLVFTYVWSLADPGDKATIDTYCAIVRHHAGQVWFVELEADQAERLRRNRSPFRLQHKPSKRNLEYSERNLLDIDRQYKVNTTGDFFYHDHYIKINTTKLPPEATAQQIIDAFGFPVTTIVSPPSD